MFRKIQGLLSISGLFLIVCTGLSAQQNAQELRLGSVVSGNLRSGGEIWYSVRITETCFLTVETTGSTDTFLEIYDAQRNLLVEDDDSGDDLNARIEILSARGSNYLVKLSAYGDESGAFRIMASYIPLSDAVELRAGSALSGNITPGQRQLYSIRAAQAGLYTVETTGDTDTYLEVYDSSFNYIDYADDNGDDTNARIDIFAEANKTYYFVLSGYDNDVSGSYRIFSSFESVSVVNNTGRSTAVALKLGEATPVFLIAANQSRWYVYQATRAATFIVRTRGTLDTILCLYDNQGNLLEEDDDSADDDNNAYISARLSNGTYYIEVKSYEGKVGHCTLHAEIR